MALSAVELAAQLTQTAAFIEADVVDVVAERVATVRVPGGGREPAAEPTAISWRCRLIPEGGRKEAPSAVDGSRQENEKWTLLAMPDADIAEDDRFTYDGRPVIVTTVSRNAYQIKAGVVTVGG